ncbi:MAG: ABC transporter transmembrane domain-containing protein [Sphingomonadales bacterium]
MAEDTGTDPHEIHSGEEKPRVAVGRLRMLWPFLRPYRGTLVCALLALVVAASAMLGIGQAIRRLVDMGFSAEMREVVDLYFIALFGVAAVLAAATFARFYFVSWLGERVVADLRKAVYGHVISLSPEFFETARAGEVTSRLTTDTTLIQSVVGSSASIALRNLLLLVGGLVLLVITSIQLTAYVVVGVPLVVAPVVFFGRKVRQLSRESQDRLADASAMAAEKINAIQTVQSFSREADERNRFGGAVEGAFQTAVRRIRARSWLTAIVILVVFGAVDFVLWKGATSVIAGVMSGGDLAAFVFYAVVVAGSVGALSEVWGELQRAAGATERLMEILVTEPVIKPPANPRPLAEPARGEVRFDNVTFHYPSRPADAALDDFCLDIRSGETVALVGPSGAGKSTVFQVLMRFYDPDKGQVLVDGVDIAAVDPVGLRERIALVPQDTVIFGASAIDNIRYGRPDASDDEVWAAARAAAAEEFIRSLPEGGNTYLGERGTRLSGGQRQRVAIARAILKDAPLLLLDEATSALDAESEVLVQGALERLMENRTTLVIAHRLATVLKADRIVVMDRGRIVDIGRHDELAAKGGLYARLAELQFGRDNGGALLPESIAG